jgi:hypothetical protein
MNTIRTGLVVLALTLVTACGTKNNGPLGGSPGDDGGAPDGGGIPQGGDSGSFMGDDGGSPGACETCSADLHQVLDCATHSVLQTCPASQACSPTGGCVAPCQGAAANKSSVGCEYYAMNPDAWSAVPDNPVVENSSAGGCYAAFVANIWPSTVTVDVDFNGQTLDISKSAYLPQGSGAGLSYAPLSGNSIPPNQVAILFLAHFHHSDDGGIGLQPDGGLSFGQGGSMEMPCPAGVTPAYTIDDAAVHGTGSGHAFHITTSAPVTAYDIYPYGGAKSYVASATLLLPVSAWDTNYVAVSGFQGEAVQGNSNKVDSNIAFVASQDDTSVTITPAAAIVGGNGVASGSAGTPISYRLNQGESLQLEQFDDLTGSVVLSDKPLGTWGGHNCMFVPDSGTRACDAAHQQIPPVRALGSEYAAVRYRDRVANSNESAPWRFVGAVDGTMLAYEPSAPANAPTTLNKGQLVEVESSGPFVVKSQDAMHPFYLAGHMTGGGSLPGYLGDPETVNVVPPQQYLEHYVFFTDPTYGETNLVIVRPAGGPDVTLDCVSGPLTGWQPIGSRYEYTRPDVQHLGAKVGACDNGRHEIQSAGPFGVTVWGWDNAVSYAYPAGASVKPINAVVVPVAPR